MASRNLSPISVLGKVRKFFHGSENPYNSKDYVYEQMVREGKYYISPLSSAKTFYLREKARERHVVHNQHIRKLEAKIMKGAYDVKSFSNRF